MPKTTTIFGDLSHKENTPEFLKALHIANNGGRGQSDFYTTWGHVVTKVLDMAIEIPLPDGTTMKPFTTAGQVKAYFRIRSSDELGDRVNPSYFSHMVGEFHRDKVHPQEAAILETQMNAVYDIFTLNVLSAVNDTDTIDTLFREIRELSEIGIVEITEEVCEGIIETTLYNKGFETREDWDAYAHKDEWTVSMVNRDKLAQDFAESCILYPHRRKGSASQKAQEQMRGLVWVSRETIESLMGDGDKSVRLRSSRTAHPKVHS